MRYGDKYNDGDLSEQTIARFVKGRKMWGEEVYGRFWKKTKDWYGIFRGIVTGGISRNDVSIPILFSQIMSDVSNKCQSILADREIVQFVANDPMMAGSARRASSLVNIQLECSGAYLKFVDLFLSGAIYGSGFWRTTWRLDEKPMLFRARILDREIVVRDKKTLFDGPDFEVVDILDIIPEPGKVRWQDVDWVIHTYYIDLDNLLELQYSAQFPMFDPEAIQRLLESPMGTQQRDSYKQRMTVYRTMTDYESRAGMNHSKPILITEYWGKVPSEFGIQGDRNVVITLANDKIVLRYEPNPFWHKELPFGMFTPMPDMHALHGTGKCEIGEKIQAMINKLANIKLDALEIFANPMFFVSNNSGLDTQQLISRPGKLNQVQGEKVSDAVMPVSPDLRALQMLWTEIEQLSGFEQMGTGIPSDVVQGIEAADRETARGFLSRKESAMGRLASEAMIAEQQVVIPLATTYHENNRQWLPLPKQVSMIGMDAVIDPDTGMPLPNQMETMTLNDVNGDYNIKAVGASKMMNKSILASQLSVYEQSALANPARMMLTNWVNFNKIYAKALGLNPMDLMIQQTTAGGVPLLNQIAAAGSGGGTGAGDMMNAMTLPGAGLAGNQPFLGNGSDTYEQ